MSDWVDKERHGVAVEYLKATEGEYEAVCDEMLKLREKLTEKGIKWRDDSSYFATRAYYATCRTKFEYRGVKWSVIHGCGTYGGWRLGEGDLGLLEAWATNADRDPMGYLRADEVLEVMEVKSVRVERGAENERTV